MSKNSNPNAGIEVQKMMYVYKLLQSQQETLSQQIELLEKQIVGVNISKSTMEGLKDLQGDHEIILPLGTNAFAKAKLVEPDKVIVAVSKEIMIEKSLEDGINSMSTLLESYKKIQERLYAQFQDVASKIDQIQPQLERYYNGQ